MYDDADSDDMEPGGSGCYGRDYWKRRFFILAGGLALVGGITWGLSAFLGAARPIMAGARASLAARDTLPPAAYGAPAGRPPSATATRTFPAAGASPSASPSRSPARTASPSPSPRPSARKAIAAGSCPPKSIVLSLFTSQERYGPGQSPQFEVYAVSTAPGTCELAYGPSAVRVLVTKAGQVMWDSATCRAQAPPGARKVRLAPGVPQVAAITWNRRSGAPGCAGSVPARASGAFNAVAVADGKSSPVRVFTLAH